jgi:hypothetical protein
MEDADGALREIAYIFRICVGRKPPWEEEEWGQ